MSAIPNRLLLLLLSLSVQSLFAQTDTIPIKKEGVPKGALEAFGVSQADLIDQLMFVMPGLGTSSREILNEQSVKPYLMPPRTKSPQGSANCYALAACLEFYVNYSNNYKLNLSPDYIFLNINKDDLVEGMLFLIQQGAVSAAIVPYESLRIPPGARNTTRFSIQNYLHLYRKETPRQQKIFDTRKALMRGNPVLVQMRVPANFPELRRVKTWDGASTKPDIVYPFLVTSYMESSETFEIMSAWGPEWGHNGYLWVKYDDFANMVENGFVLIPSENYQTEGN